MRLLSSAAHSERTGACCTVVYEPAAAHSVRAVFWRFSYTGALRHCEHAAPLPHCSIAALLATPDAADRHDFVAVLVDGSALLLCSADCSCMRLPLQPMARVHGACFDGGALHICGQRAQRNGLVPLQPEMQLTTLQLAEDRGGAGVSACRLQVPPHAGALTTFVVTGGKVLCTWGSGAVTVQAHAAQRRRAAATTLKCTQLATTHVNNVAEKRKNGIHAKRQRDAGTNRSSHAPCLAVCAVALGPRLAAVLSQRPGDLHYMCFDTAHCLVHSAGVLHSKLPVTGTTLLAHTTPGTSAAVVVASAGVILRAKLQRRKPSLAAALGTAAGSSETPAARAMQSEVAQDSIMALTMPAHIAAASFSPIAAPAAASRAVPLPAAGTHWQAASERAANDVLHDGLQRLTLDASPGTAFVDTVTRRGHRPHVCGGLGVSAAGYMAQRGAWPAMEQLLAVAPPLTTARSPNVLHACVRGGRGDVARRMLRSTQDVNVGDFAAALGLLLVPSAGGGCERDAHTLHESLRRQARQLRSARTGSRRTRAARAASALDGFSIWHLPLHAFAACPLDARDAAAVARILGGAALARFVTYLLRWSTLYVLRTPVDAPASGGTKCAPHFAHVHMFACSAAAMLVLCRWNYRWSASSSASICSVADCKTSLQLEDRVTL